MKLNNVQVVALAACQMANIAHRDGDSAACERLKEWFDEFGETPTFKSDGHRGYFRYSTTQMARIRAIQDIPELPEIDL